MGESLWTVFRKLINLATSGCSSKIPKICSSGFLSIICPCSSLNHIFVISVDIILLFFLLFIFIYKAPTKKILPRQQSLCFSKMLNSAAFLNGSLGLVYTGIGFRILGEKLGEENTILPLHDWLVVLLQGFTWFFLGLVVRFKRHQFLHAAVMRLCSLLAFTIAGFLCVTSIWEATVGDAVSIKMLFDVISFPGAILLMFFCTFLGPKYAGTDSDIDVASFYTPLPGEGGSGGDKINSDASLPAIEEAGHISKLTFWWLNSLMKKGREKTLDDTDIPQLRREDRAEMCYLMFMEQLKNKQKKKQSSDSPSIFFTIFLWQWKPILISGFFALIKVLTLSTGPLFLRAFILIAEGKETFKYEGYALTGGLFLTKCLESLSEAMVLSD